MTRPREPTPILDFIGRRCVKMLAYLRGFFWSHLPVWVGIVVALLVYYTLQAR